MVPKQIKVDGDTFYIKFASWDPSYHYEWYLQANYKPKELKNTEFSDITFPVEVFVRTENGRLNSKWVDYDFEFLHYQFNKRQKEAYEFYRKKLRES